MPTARALKLCPALLMVPPDFSLYSRLSKEVFSILETFSPIVEATGIDEGFIDMTGTQSLWGPPIEAASKLRARVYAATGLTVSVGIAANRLVAKIATDQCKPNNFLQIPAGQESSFLAPLSIAVMPGCGKVTQLWLLDREVKTLGQLQRYPVDVLEKHLGKFGRYLFESSWGKGSVEFHEEAKTRSISRERTFSEDIDDLLTLQTYLREMTAELGRELRESNEYARAIRLKLRYPPFDTVTRSRVLKSPTQGDQKLLEAALTLFDDNWEDRAPLRLIGVGCVLGDGVTQLNLFENVKNDEKTSKVDHLKDQLTRRFGPQVLKKKSTPNNPL